MTHWDLADEEFLASFQDCSLGVELFSHEAHLRLAWLHLNLFEKTVAEQNVSEQLKAFTKHVGATEKYNHTVTLAAVKAVNHFISKSSTTNFKAFISENSRLKTDFKALLAQHYLTDIFNSEKAKVEFIEPELTPF